MGLDLMKNEMNGLDITESRVEDISGRSPPPSRESGGLFELRPTVPTTRTGSHGQTGADFKARLTSGGFLHEGIGKDSCDVELTLYRAAGGPFNIMAFMQKTLIN
jgi:hypothetical protein